MDILFLIGRILFSVIFISAGFNHLKDFTNTVEMVKKTKAPFPKLSAAAMSFFSLVGGLSVAFGFYAEIGAFLLFIFLIPTTFIVHSFWRLPDDEKEIQSVHFFKNLALMGTTLMIFYYGSGPFSL
ncbi:DoxX family protein [Bacillus spongiae]|uniref:DoxX family protein n=1 Tax=Bacillus spongiae TaxID=2683610 RepID=A0ABU8HBX7_9BACI